MFTKLDRKWSLVLESDWQSPGLWISTFAMASVIYSFVVDGVKKLQDQAHIFLLSLIRSGDTPDRIHVHLTPGARDAVDFVKGLQIYGINVHNIAPFLDGTYCNKLMQIANLPLDQADCIALCDTDLAFLDNLDAIARPDAVQAKPVDLPNPPLAYLEQAYRICGLSRLPHITTTSCGGGSTWSSNCNGGVYIIPCDQAGKIDRLWRKYATLIHGSSGFLENFAHHIDQISFAMAILDSGVVLDALPIEYNFPVHLSEYFAQDAGASPRVLHYHWLHNGRESLSLTGHPGIDRSITSLNGELVAARHAFLKEAG